MAAGACALRVAGRALLLAFALSLNRADAAAHRPRALLARRLTAPRSFARSLLPLPDLTAEAGVPDGVILGAVQACDLEGVGNLLVSSFYPELITIPPASSPGGFSPLERAILETPVAWLNMTYSAYLADSVRHFVECRLGPERLAVRSPSAALLAPRLPRGTTRGTSIALVAADKANGRLLAFVELSVRPLDGRVPADMLDDASALLRSVLPGQLLQCAYLCNLCVAPHARRRGIGSALVRASQAVVGARGWGHDALYLHVGTHDAPTARLYSSLGFEPLRQYDPKPWQVKWLGAADVVFYRRWLSANNDGAGRRAAAADRGPRPTVQPEQRVAEV